MPSRTPPLALPLGPPPKTLKVLRELQALLHRLLGTTLLALLTADEPRDVFLEVYTGAVEAEQHEVVEPDAREVRDEEWLHARRAPGASE
mmetsp:Transcript_56402/g.150887  ORF Transcript_56402/g.150887 Transcript_56402/m.150887 type:complete len:90 (+) Transcript_56402:798-1067(+)